MILIRVRERTKWERKKTETDPAVWRIPEIPDVMMLTRYFFPTDDFYNMLLLEIIFVPNNYKGNACIFAYLLLVLIYSMVDL